jgi:hypothetical protein
VRPLLLRSTSQFRPAGPPALTSRRYTREFNEVKAFGAKTGSLRTPQQTQTALFFSDIGIVALQTALRDLVTRHRLDISDSARLFAAVDMSVADGIGVSWDSKLRHGFWRPIHAIQLAADDGNPATTADPAWEPLIVNPPYPEYTSGLTTVVGAYSRALTRVLGTRRIDLYITSAAARSPDTTSSRARSTVTRSMAASGRASTSGPPTWWATGRARGWVTGRSTTTSSAPAEGGPVSPVSVQRSYA